MATVTFIRYAKQSAGTLSRVSGYVSQEGKVMMDEGLQLVSGQNCTPQLAEKEFRATRDAFRKESPVWFYHYVQSFHPDEPITGPEAHQVAKEFAEEAWPESEVLIATHIDADHVHTHFLINAVCFQTGKMLRQGPNTLKRLRKLSDKVCEKHHLSILPPRPVSISAGMTAREYRSAAKGQSWKFRLMNTIDECMRYARTRDEFIALMRSESYDVRWTDSRRNITYTTPDGLKCRDDRLHQEKYLKEAMEREFRIRSAFIAGGIEADESVGGSAHTARDTSYRTGVAGTAGGSGGSTVVPAGADPAAGTAGEPPHALGDGDAAQGADKGAAGDQGAGTTGWEEERAALLAAPFRAPGDLPVTASPRPAGIAGVSGGLAGDVVQLGRALERAQSAPSVRDTTAMPTHGDRKALAKEREKKIAQGHKPDDRQEAQGPNLSV